MPGYKLLVLISLALILLLITYLAPSIPQDLSYHHFADSRNVLGMPNFLNVISNLPFLLIAPVGIYQMQTRRQAELAEKTGMKLSWFFVFAGIFLVGLGSAFYHWSPDNSRLVWDRLPMTLVFMSFAAVIIAERTPVRSAIPVLSVLISLGIASVLYWYYTEQQHAGDLRLYIFVQFAPMIILPVLLLLFREGPRLFPELGYVFLFYALAKFLEFADSGVFHLLGFVSGHTLKHFAAVCATWYMVVLLKKRHRKAPDIKKNYEGNI
jgi:hypothetical protein